MTPKRHRAYRVMTAVGPLIIATMLMLAHAGVRLGSLSSDELAGFGCGVGAGLSLVGLIALNRRGAKSACDEL